MLTFEEKPLTLAGYRSRLIERPHASDLTLLFVHGWADSADTFKPLMSALADVPARLVAIDLPNFGAADDLPPGPQLPHFIRFVGAALEHFGAQGTLLPIGQSLGGRCLMLAAKPPHTLHLPGCVVIGPAPLQLPSWQKMLVRNASLAPSASKLGDETSREERVAQFLRSFQRSCFIDISGVPRSVFDDYLSHYTPARMDRHMSNLIQIGGELEQPIDLSRLDCHVEMIWGELDRMAPLSGARTYQNTLPDLNLTVFAGCGHHAHLERVQETAAIVRKLLTRSALQRAL